MMRRDERVRGLRAAKCPATGRAWPLLLPLAACAAPAEAPPDAAAPEPASAYRIERIEAPETARPVGVDHDGDGDRDNQAAMILRAVFAIYDGDVLAEAWEERLAARLAALDWRVAPGALDPVPLGALADLGAGAPDGWHPVVDLRLDGDVLSGALAPGYERVIAEAFAPFVTALHADGASRWGEAADRDGDGVITADELMADLVFQTITRADQDGALSFAFRVETTEVELR